MKKIVSKLILLSILLPVFASCSSSAVEVERSAWSYTSMCYFFPVKKISTKDFPESYWIVTRDVEGAELCSIAEFEKQFQEHIGSMSKKLSSNELRSWAANLLAFAAIKHDPEVLAYVILKCKTIDAAFDFDHVDKRGMSAVHYAAREGTDKHLDLLVKNGASLSKKTSNGESPLHVAAEANNSSTITYLLEHQVDINAKDQMGHTAAQIAIINNSIAALDSLLKAGANILPLTTKLWGPLHLAALHGCSLDLFKLLHTKFKPCFTLINSIDFEGRTALHFAAEHCSVDVCEFLLTHGAQQSLMRKCYRGRNILHFAVSKLDNLRFFLTLVPHAQQVVDERDLEGRTPLHHAAASGEGASYQLLQEHGAITFLTDKDGYTPHDLLFLMEAIHHFSFPLKDVIDVAVLPSFAQPSSTQPEVFEYTAPQVAESKELQAGNYFWHWMKSSTVQLTTLMLTINTATDRTSHRQFLSRACQCAEFALKAYITFHLRKTPKETHNLRELFNTCCALGGGNARLATINDSVNKLHGGYYANYEDVTLSPEESLKAAQAIHSSIFTYLEKTIIEKSKVENEKWPWGSEKIYPAPSAPNQERAIS